MDKANTNTNTKEKPRTATLRFRRIQSRVADQPVRCRLEETREFRVVHRDVVQDEYLICTSGCEVLTALCARELHRLFGVIAPARHQALVRVTIEVLDVGRTPKGY